MNDKDRSAQDDKIAAERATNITDCDGPLCRHCNADYHTDPECPAKLFQERLERDRMARRQKWERNSYGRRSRR